MNYLTANADHDYRFLSRLISELFSHEELAQGCVRMGDSSTKNVPYKILDETKFGFVKGY